MWDLGTKKGLTIISKTPLPVYAALHACGFGDCQLLLSMNYNTPDNTLPIMWYNEEPKIWVPIFKRYDKNTNMKNNPFDVTKAVDYTDDEIFKYWVDMDGQNFMTVMQPGSLVPMMIVGSKGSGKTHIMKYYSYELQKIRCKASEGSVPELMAKERFIGVYIRCSGFNAEKFSGKGVSDDVWSVLYAYFWELWVGERIVNMLIDMIKEGILVDFDEEAFVKGVYSLFVRPVNRDCSLVGLKEYLYELQNDVEYEVQGFLFKGNEMPMVDMKLSMSRLTYGIPTLLKETVPYFKDKYIMYLIDELENFSESQQQLVQTLLREKPMSCSFA